jgi:hypothetical protein
LTQLPRSAFFEGARGRFRIGTVIHAPRSDSRRVELRPAPGWRIEAAIDAAIDAQPPTGYVSVLTVDSAKHLLGLGGGHEAGGWQIGAALGIVILSDVQCRSRRPAYPADVDPRSARSGDSERRFHRSYDLLTGLRFASAL